MKKIRLFGKVWIFLYPDFDIGYHNCQGQEVGGCSQQWVNLGWITIAW